MTTSTESEEYGFIAHLNDDGTAHLTDCMGGGVHISYAGEDDLTDAVEEFIKSRAREYAEAMVEDLEIDGEADDEDDQLRAEVKP